MFNLAVAGTMISNVAISIFQVFKVRKKIRSISWAL